MENEFELVYKFLASLTKKWGHNAQLRLYDDGSGYIGYQYVEDFVHMFEFNNHKELMEIVHGTK